MDTEYPADDLEALFEALLMVEVFVRVFTGVVAAHAQAAARTVVEVFDAQHAVVFDGVDFTVDDLGAASVDGEGGAFVDDVDHAVVDHVGAYRAVGVDAQGFQAVQETRMRSVEVKVGWRGISTSVFSGRQAGPVRYLPVSSPGGCNPCDGAYQQVVGRRVLKGLYRQLLSGDLRRTAILRSR